MHPAKVATPLLAVTALLVQVSVAAPGVVMVSAMLALLDVTVLPWASCTVTTGCVLQWLPAVAPLGCVVKASLVAVPMVPVAVKVTADVCDAVVVAVSRLAPAVAPSVQLPTVAMPFASATSRPRPRGIWTPCATS